jgi:predicted phage terminase large subunit-like protein
VNSPILQKETELESSQNNKEYDYNTGIWFFINNKARHQAKAILGFSSIFLANRYDDPKPIPAFHEEMWAICSSSHPRVAIAAPRGHAKSTAITFAYALYLLMTRRSQHMLLISSNESLASSFLNDIKIELVENENLASYFKFVGFDKEAESEIIGKFSDGTKFRVIVKGANQRMRGLKWERKRPDYVLCDDMEDEELVMNEVRRDKFENWFLGAVLPIIKSGGKIRVVGTIMHMDSLLESMMPPTKDIDTYTDGLRTYSKLGSKRHWFSIKYRAHDEEFTQILWPQQYDEELLRMTRQNYAQLGKLDIYGQEYLNYPIDPATSFFKRDDFLPMDENNLEAKKSYYIGVDLAISKEKRAAKSAIVVGGLDSEGFLNIVDVRRGQWDGLEIIEELFSVNQRWAPELIRIEEENIAKALGPFLYKTMDERQIYLPLYPGKPTKDKDQRAQSIRNRMRAGKVRFNKDAEWYPDFEEELVNYPKFPRVDQVDAYAWLGLTLEEMTEPATRQEEEDEQYEQMLEQDSGEFGRSAVTGY